MYAIRTLHYSSAALIRDETMKRFSARTKVIKKEEKTKVNKLGEKKGMIRI